MSEIRFFSRECYLRGYKDAALKKQDAVEKVRWAKKAKEKMIKDIQADGPIILLAQTAEFTLWDNRPLQSIMIESLPNGTTINMDYELFENFRECMDQMKDYEWKRVDVKDFIDEEDCDCDECKAKKKEMVN
jgi:hypothetical protein